MMQATGQRKSVELLTPALTVAAAVEGQGVELGFSVGNDVRLLRSSSDKANIFTVGTPMAVSNAPSHRTVRLDAGSWRLFTEMCAQTLRSTSAKLMGSEPIRTASDGVGKNSSSGSAAEGASSSSATSELSSSPLATSPQRSHFSADAPFSLTRTNESRNWLSKQPRQRTSVQCHRPPMTPSSS